MALAFVTKLSDKCKSALLSAFEVKDLQKTVSAEEKVDAIIWRKKKVNEWLTYAIMLDLLLVA